jgi:hypothetical protein
MLVLFSREGKTNMGKLVLEFNTDGTLCIEDTLTGETIPLNFTPLSNTVTKVAMGACQRFVFYRAHQTEKNQKVK